MWVCVLEDAYNSSSFNLSMRGAWREKWKWFTLFMWHTMFWRLCLNYIIKWSQSHCIFVNYFLSSSPIIREYHIQYLIEPISTIYTSLYIHFLYGPKSLSISIFLWIFVFGWMPPESLSYENTIFLIASNVERRKQLAKTGMYIILFTCLYIEIHFWFVSVYFSLPKMIGLKKEVTLLRACRTWI